MRTYITSRDVNLAVNREATAMRKSAGIGRQLPKNRLSDEDTRFAKALVPPDTRDLTGRVFGDPVPGRSALDEWLTR